MPSSVPIRADVYEPDSDRLHRLAETYALELIRAGREGSGDIARIAYGMAADMIKGGAKAEAKLKADV